MSVIPSKRTRAQISAGLIVDLFAGGGGASIGIEAAMGRHVDIAINHDPVAIAVHAANHPRTVHYTTDIWDVSPKKATCGKPVLLLHASPDCKHFSRAKGGKPKSQKIRSLAWVVHRWAKDVGPQVITMENVPEFLEWGPLDSASCAVPERKGETFKRWKRDLERLGYVVEHRVMKACDYGAPTSRKRLFIVARRDGKPITWPKPSHGPGLPLPFHTAAECIDWAIPCPSIFERSKPLADKTLKRIAAGVMKFVINSASPFIVQVNHGGDRRPNSVDEPLHTVTATQRSHAVVTPFVATIDNGSSQGTPAGANAPLSTVVGTNQRHALVAPTLIQTSYGERKGQSPRVLDLQKPLGTVVAQGQKHALVAAFIAQHNLGQVGHTSEKPLPTITAIDSHALVTSHLATFRGTAPGQPMAASVEQPLGTISAGGIHAGEVRTFLTTYYGSPVDVGQSLNDPMRTVVTKDRFGLVTIAGVDYQITDIGMRMLEPHELLAAQFGRFAKTTSLAAAKTKKDKVRLIGNSVCPELEEAVVAAQFPELLQRRAA